MTSASPVVESQEEAETRAATDAVQAESPREASASPARVGRGEREIEIDARTAAAWIGGVGLTRLGQRRSGIHNVGRTEQRAAEQSRRRGTPSPDVAADWTRGDGRGARGRRELGEAKRGEGPGSSSAGGRRPRGSTPRRLRLGVMKAAGRQLLLPYDWSRRMRQWQGVDHQ